MSLHLEPIGDIPTETARVAQAAFSKGNVVMRLRDEFKILSANSCSAMSNMEHPMSLHPEPIGEIPTETVRIARAAFPKGTLVTRLRDEFSELYKDEEFHKFYSKRGQPGLPPWRLALVTVFQFLQHLSDRQAAEAIRARIDWKYALGLELTDPGFHFSVLSEFRTRLVSGQAEHLLLNTMLERFKARDLVKPRGKQRTDSTYVLAAVHDLSLVELVIETLRATLDDLAAVVPDWLRPIAPAVWIERYGRRVEQYRLPNSQDKRLALALQTGADGFVLLDALDTLTAPAAAGKVPMVQTLRDVWWVHYVRDDGQVRWRSIAELPPVAERMQSPYDPQAHFSMKRQLSWTGYKVHVTETCDDDAAHLITHVKTCPSMQPDMTSTADIHARLAEKDLLPAEHFVDAGYVDAGLLVSSQQDHTVSLEGPVRGIASRVGPGYELPHFVIDWDAEQVTCPPGKTSISWRTIRAADGSPRIHGQFSRSDCGTCVARTLCAPTSGRRSVHFHLRDEYEALKAARARMKDPAWVKRYHRRAGVEGTLSQAVRSFGMRRSRYIGLAKTGLQEAYIAAAINVTRVVRWLDGSPRAKTRVTRFTALARAA